MLWLSWTTKTSFRIKLKRAIIYSSIVDNTISHSGPNLSPIWLYFCIPYILISIASKTIDRIICNIF